MSDLRQLLFNARALLTVLILIGIGTVLGCATEPKSWYEARDPEYSYSAKNATGLEVRDAGFTFDLNGQTRHFEFGVLAIGAEATWSRAPDPMATRVTFHWTTLPDGIHHEGTVVVASKVSNSARWKGEIFFRLTKDGVESIPLSYDDERFEGAEAARKGVLRTVDDFLAERSHGATEDTTTQPTTTSSQK